MILKKDDIYQTVTPINSYRRWEKKFCYLEWHNVMYLSYNSEKENKN